MYVAWKETIPIFSQMNATSGSGTTDTGAFYTSSHFSNPVSLEGEQAWVGVGLWLWQPLVLSYKGLRALFTLWGVSKPSGSAGLLLAPKHDGA